MSNKNKAEQIFKDKFDELIGNSDVPENTIEDWIKDNSIAYNKFIIPSIVQALEMDKPIEAKQIRTLTVPANAKINYESKKVTCFICSNQESDVTFNATLKIDDESTSKIQPGQKLEDGDYFEGGTEEQYKKLRMGYVTDDINYTLKLAVKYGVHFYRDCLFISQNPDENKTRYSFPDFKQLCENTF